MKRCLMLAVLLLSLTGYAASSESNDSEKVYLFLHSEPKGAVIYYDNKMYKPTGRKPVVLHINKEEMVSNPLIKAVWPSGTTASLRLEPGRTGYLFSRSDDAPNLEADQQYEATLKLRQEQRQSRQEQRQSRQELQEFANGIEQFGQQMQDSGQQMLNSVSNQPRSQVFTPPGGNQVVTCFRNGQFTSCRY